MITALAFVAALVLGTMAINRVWGRLHASHIRGRVLVPILFVLVGAAVTNDANIALLILFSVALLTSCWYWLARIFS
jgi:hypothetical protein